MTVERPRVVLLGASNLTRALPQVLGVARAVAGQGPFDAFVAAGHGRSYGRWSRVLARGLPGILESGLWRALARRRGAPTHALLTDIGNDLAYGESPARVSGWIGECLARLAPLEGRVAMTLLPEESLGRLGPVRFRLLVTLLFPGRSVTRHGIRRSAAELNRRLSELAAARGVELVVPQTGWYGADAIHIRRRARPAAWESLLAPWQPPAPIAVEPLRLGRAAPEHRTLLGIEQRRPQPSRHLPDGTTISLF